MKKILYILLISSLGLLLTFCKSTKNNNSVAPVISKPTDVYYDDDYVALPKSQRKTFFKGSEAEDKWVDSIYNKLSFNEKVGQLFMIAAYSNKDAEHFKTIDNLITDYKIGGLIFFQGGPNRQAKLTNRFQAKSNIPLFIGIDAEWGLSMRLDSTFRYPWNMTLGAIRDYKLIQKLGSQMGKESKRMGIHFNFAPVIDINTNPLNPIIGNRSFGEDKYNVTESAIALMTGFQNEGVFSTGKHFPGHGDTSTDSHHTLPVVNFSKDRIDHVELYPYKRMFDEGLESVMVAHLNIPSLEPRDAFPTSLSKNVVTDLLQKDLGFSGLIFTDALNMKGASNFKKPGEIDLEAFLAGNDILLFAEDVPKAVSMFNDAYSKGLLPDNRIETSVKKILHYKYKAGLNNYKPIDLKNLYNDLNPTTNIALQYQLYENAITVLKNKGEILPIKDYSKKIAYIKTGDDTNTSFLNTLKNYTEVTEIICDNSAEVLTELKDFDLVIIGFHKADKAWKKHEFTPAEIQFIHDISVEHKVILDVFSKPYTLLPFDNFDHLEGLIVSYQNSDIAQQVSAELIFGAIESKGKLPVSINKHFKVNDGILTRKLNVLGFSSPENVGMNSSKLAEIDKIAKKAIDEKMTPGIQILVAKDGKVIYQKSYGYHTYENVTKVKNTDIYDVASITKMTSTLPLTMQLFDKGRVNLETKLSEMIPELKGSNKENISFLELLSHYAKLQAWIPFYKETVDANKIPLESIYSKTYSIDYSYQVSENLFIKNTYQDSIFTKIKNSKLIEKQEYKYSDLTFILLKKFIEKEYNNSLDELSEKHFFKHLGMNNTTYNPLRKFDMYMIPPTEEDNYFRHTTIQGYVHDMAAAMQGGVGGHAGVFSNSMDIAKMMQMFLQKGNYNGYEFFKSETFDVFNKCFFCEKGNRRGLGFDKPQISSEGPTCGCVSTSSFGHTGFTGTMAWADPETNIIYVFLSNRTYPDSNAPNKLSKSNIREDIQKIIQEAIIK